jgi:hypothetical protein
LFTVVKKKLFHDVLAVDLEIAIADVDLSLLSGCFLMTLANVSGG